MKKFIYLILPFALFFGINQVNAFSIDLKPRIAVRDYQGNITWENGKLYKLWNENYWGTTYYLGSGGSTSPINNLIANSEPVNITDDNINNKEELYDLRWDPNEEYNILERCYYDANRRHTVYYDEHYFYPFKDDAMSAYQKIIRYKKEIWRELSSSEKRKMKLYNFLKKTKRILLSLKK